MSPERGQLVHKASLLRDVRRLVVKIGSAVLSGPHGLDRPRIRRLARSVEAARATGREVILVSSGAVAAGRARLGLDHRPRTIPDLQAVASVGQIDLMGAYQAAFAPRGITVAQVLLTHADLTDRRRYLNAKHTLRTLLDRRVLPVVNENDTVAVEELTFGDNDNLSALTAALADADLLVMLSDVGGLYTADPHVAADATLIPVAAASADLGRRTGTSHSGLGRGGMVSKLAAARKAAAAGIPTVIADGRLPGVLEAVLDPAREVGTLILPAANRLTRRKHWIAHTLRPAGTLKVDDGAREAVVNKGRSLLPAGLREVRGNFAAGACVRLVDARGQEFARGLTAYSTSELERIKGAQSREIVRRLGYTLGDEVVHRDDLVVTAGEQPA